MNIEIYGIIYWRKDGTGPYPMVTPTGEMITEPILQSADSIAENLELDANVEARTISLDNVHE